MGLRVTVISARRASQWGAALVLSCAASGSLQAAVAHFGYSTALRALYTTDVFRNGEGGPGDYVTGLRLNAFWSEQSPRSETRLSYSPEYYTYADFQDLNHLDQRLSATWRFRPNRRSAVALRQGFYLSTRQSSFRESEDEDAQPVVRRSERRDLDFEPSVTMDLGRLWRMETRGRYRSQTFDRPDLVDSTQAGLEVSTTTRVGRESRIGGRVRGDVFDFDQGGATTGAPGRRQLVAAEAVWTSDGSGLFAWSLGAGGFRDRGEGFRVGPKPTLQASCAWGLRAGRFLVAYDLGYSTYGGYGGISRSQTGEIGFVRRWRRAWEMSARGVRISRESLDGVTVQQGSIRGYQFDAGLSYRWTSGVGLLFQQRLIRQAGSIGTDLDYQEVSIAFTFVPRETPGFSRSARIGRSET